MTITYQRHEPTLKVRTIPRGWKSKSGATLHDTMRVRGGLQHLKGNPEWWREAMSTPSRVILQREAAQRRNIEAELIRLGRKAAAKAA